MNFKPKYITTIAFTFVLSLLSYGMDILPESDQSSYAHLVEINAEWKNHKGIGPKTIISFANDTERISFHLNLVVAHLQKNFPESLSEEARLNRTNLLDELYRYANTKVFPTNLYHKERTPYFIDDFNVHCAVGYLIMKSGHSELSNRIRDEHNYDYIRDITTPGILEWAKEYGFELEELAWIQPGYTSSTTFTGLGDTDGEVTILCKDYTNNRLIYAGNFDNINGGTTPCSGIGYYEFGTMHCLGNGIDGVIHHAYEANGNIYVSGALISGGNTYSQAIFSNGNWTYENIPGMEGITARTGISGASDFKREVVLMNDQGSNEHEVWRLNNSDVWEKQATANGPINSIAQGNTHIAYGGTFSSLTLQLSSGNQQLSTTNACLRENNSENWSQLTGQIATEVNVVKWLNGTFFFGGIDTPPANIDEPFAPIAMLHSDTLIGLYGGLTPNYSFGFSTEVNVTDIDVVGDNRLVICGNFAAGSAIFFGDNLAVIDMTNFPIFAGNPGPSNIETIARGSWNGQILRSCVIVDQTLYVGGDFTTAPTSTVPDPLDPFNDLPVHSAVGHIAQMNEPLNINTADLLTFDVYPNPVTETLHVKASYSPKNISILDMKGSILLTESNVISMDVSQLKAGHYLVKVEMDQGQIVYEKLVKL